VNLYHVIYIAGFTAGLLLQVSLLASVFGKPGRSQGRRALAAFLFAIALWQAGNLGTMFVGVLLWPGRGEAVLQMTAHRAFDLMSVLGAFFIPPLLLHLFFSLYKAVSLKQAPLRFVADTRRKPGGQPAFRSLAGDIGVFVFYLPVIFFLLLIVAQFLIGGLPLAQNIQALYGSERLIGVAGREPAYKDLKILILFVGYFASACILATLLAYRCAKKTRRIEDKLFFRAFFRMFLAADVFCGVILGSMAALAYGFQNLKVHAVTGMALKLFSMAASLVPGAVLAWFIYRYNYMSYRLRRRPLQIAVAAVVIVAYIFAARSLGPRVEEALSVNFQILEAALLVVIVALAWPARRAIRAVVHRFIAKREDLYRTRLARISEQLNSPSIFTLSHLFDFVAENISKTFETQRVIVALFRKDRNGAPLPAIHATNFKKRAMKVETVLSFLRNRPSGFLDFSLARNPQLIEEMRTLRCQIILPLVRGGQVRGFMGLGHHSGLWQYSATEIELLGLLASHLITAAENLTLVDDKVQLRRKMLEGEKMLSLGRLSAGVAHEVKNPLSAIKTVAQVAREDLEPGSRMHKDLTMIVGEIDRLSRVVEQLLRFARPAPGDATVRASLILDDVLAILKREALRNRITLRAEIHSNLARVRVNAEALKEILFNLILNGIQAMPEGGTLTVGAECRPAKAAVDKSTRHNLVITVADTGPGVPEDMKERVFEPFFSTKEDGTGLGLAIVRERTEQVEGAIRVENDGGAKFTVEIPVAPEPRETPLPDALNV